jgi:hypothetical protein
MLSFQVHGTSGEIYLVEAERIGTFLRMTCSCQAADYGIHCHHRLELLAGDASAVVSGNAADVSTLVDMLAGSTLEAALADLHKAEAIQQAAKRERDKRMKAVDRLFAARDD